MDTSPRTDRTAKTHRLGAKVISLQLNAAYFYERGVKFLERNDLTRALKAFRKTVEFEPDNPVNHCNLAGVLSEMGDFTASNEVLLHILESLDPTMAECQFYMANNYANMGEYATAEEHVLRYLSAEPDGEYAEDAEEMLSVLMDEFGGGRAYEVWNAKRQEEEREAAKQDGRHLLEDGQFEAAVEWLLAIVAREPDNTAAQNNLSLAYYYTGQCEAAIQIAQSVLDEQLDNVHALCNLAVFTSQGYAKEQHNYYKSQLVKLFPLHYDQAMKLGTTLGLLGDHAAAMAVFRRLVRLVEYAEPVLLHSLAAAAANAGYLRTARKWWLVMRDRPEMKEISIHYLRHVDECMAEGRATMRVSYQYDLPLQVQFAQMKKRLSEGNLLMWRQDPLLRASLYWGLRHGNPQMRKAVIRTLSLIADADAQKALRMFLKRTDVESSLQAAALFALQRSGAKEGVDVWRDNRLVTLQMSEVPADIILQIDSLWAQVWQSVDAWLVKRDLAGHRSELHRMWISFLHHTFLRKDVRMGKPEVWVAGLLYAGLKHTADSVSQKELAEQFQVSASAIRNAAGKLAPYFIQMPHL